MQTNKVNVHNLTSEKYSVYHLKGLNNPGGGGGEGLVASDRENNLFISCNDHNLICVKQSLHSTTNVVLDRSDGIARPWSIYYNIDNDELLVMNDNARSVFIFKKK